MDVNVDKQAYYFFFATATLGKKANRTFKVFFRLAFGAGHAASAVHKLRAANGRKCTQLQQLTTKFYTGLGDYADSALTTLLVVKRDRKRNVALKYNILSKGHDLLILSI